MHTLEPDRMMTEAVGARRGRRFKIAAWWMGVGLPLYLLSTGPVSWATNNGYLPSGIEWMYLPLAPLMRIGCINQLFYYYTVVLWHGFPYGYTTI